MFEPFPECVESSRLAGRYEETLEERGGVGRAPSRMVNIKLPITHLIITSKITPQMSSTTSQEDKPHHEGHKAEHFTAGSLIRLGSGDTKNIEDLQTEDFIKSASVCPDFSLQHSKLLRLGNFYRPRIHKDTT